MDVLSAKVLGTVALVFGTVFLATSVVRLIRPEPDLFLVVLNVALGVLWLAGGVWLWRFGLRRTKQPGRPPLTGPDMRKGTEP